MLFLRLAIFILVITLVVLFLFFAITKNKKYLLLIKTIFNYSLYVGVIVGLIYLIMRALQI